jgi:hypothetical protein
VQWGLEIPGTVRMTRRVVPAVVATLTGF